MRDRLLLVFFKLFSRIFLFFPESVRFAFIRFLSKVLYFFASKHKKVIDSNLKFVSNVISFSDKEKIDIKKYCFYNMILWFKSIVENLYNSDISYNISFKNRNHYDNALQNGEKIILISAHYGNIEILGDALNRNFKEMTFVMRESNLKGIDEFIIHSREKSGGKVVYKSGALKYLAKSLKNGNPIALLIDQSINPKDGIEIEFFGQKTYQTRSTSALARKFDAKIIPVSITNLKDGDYELEFYEPIDSIKSKNEKEDIKKLTQLQANALQNIILKDPKQWFWCHKRWKTNHRYIYE